MGEHDPLIPKCRMARILEYLLKYKTATIYEIMDYIKNISLNHCQVIVRKMIRAGLIIQIPRPKHRRGYSWHAPKQYMAVADNHKVHELVAILQI